MFLAYVILRIHLYNADQHRPFDVGRVRVYTYHLVFWGDRVDETAVNLAAGHDAEIENCYGCNHLPNVTKGWAD